MQGTAVGEYVARQSAIVALAPATAVKVPLELLESDFQRRMLIGDTCADAGERIELTPVDGVLIDLVDERRGVWQFPDGTYLTNSVEAYRTGIERWAPEMGARLIEFGTDEHFALWKQGFTVVTRKLARTGVPLILLNIAWAAVFEGQPSPHGVASLIGRFGRRSRRRINRFARSAQEERSLFAGVVRLTEDPSTRGDRLAKIAREANAEYGRYAEEAISHVTTAITRQPDEVRMDEDHKWGIGPYHYSNSNYESIGNELISLLSKA